MSCLRRERLARHRVECGITRGIGHGSRSIGVRARRRKSDPDGRQSRSRGNVEKEVDVVESIGILGCRQRT